MLCACITLSRVIKEKDRIPFHCNLHHYMYHLSLFCFLLFAAYQDNFQICVGTGQKKEKGILILNLILIMILILITILMIIMLIMLNHLSLRFGFLIRVTLSAALTFHSTFFFSFFLFIFIFWWCCFISILFGRIFIQVTHSRMWFQNKNLHKGFINESQHIHTRQGFICISLFGCFHPKWIIKNVDFFFCHCCFGKWKKKNIGILIALMFELDRALPLIFLPLIVLFNCLE